MTAEQYAAASPSMRVREAQVGGRILVMTLLDAGVVHKREMDALYRRRWRIEFDLVRIKTTLQPGRAALSHTGDDQERSVGAPVSLQSDAPADGRGS